jgi:predicted phage terminase large subunit-like protein
MLTAIGGLIDESKQLYPHWKAVYKAQAKEWHFPNGAQIKFVAMPADLSEVQGWQATNILVDEGAEFTLAQILAMSARLRGARYKGKIGMTISCNPSRHSWLYEILEPYCLDKATGIPVPGTENRIRWFVILNGKMKWGNSKEELYAEHGAGLEMGKTFIPMSFRFVPMDVYSNPVLLKNNPSYLANLLAQSRVAQARYLYGSWTAVPEGNSFFQRKWVEVVEAAPVDAVRVRSWDIAASVPSETNHDPDYTAGVLMSRTKEGVYYIEDVKRDRKLTDGVMKMIVDTANEDGLDIPVTIPADTGAGGKSSNMFFTRHFAERGLIIKSIPMSGWSKKVTRFLPFAAMCESGAVRIVRGTWNDDYLSELENFVGSRNMHDDMVDATSDAFSTLCRQAIMPNFALPVFTQESPIPSL